MLNLLRGEFYKLRKSKSFYACCIAMVACVLLLYGMLWLADRIQQGEIENGSYGVVVGEESLNQEKGSIWNEISVLDIEQSMCSSFASVIIAMFGAIFIVAEYGNGAVKNITGKGHHRWKVFFAKYAVTTAGAVMLLMVMILAVLLLGCIFLGTENWNRTFWKDFLAYNGLQLLFGTVLIGIVAAISEVCRSLGAGISGSIGVVLFSSMITSGLDLVFHRWNFKATDYWVMDLIGDCPLTNMDSTFAIRAVVSSVIWLILFAGIGVWHFQKADIK